MAKGTARAVKAAQARPSVGTSTAAAIGRVKVQPRGAGRVDALANQARKNLKAAKARVARRG